MIGMTAGYAFADQQHPLDGAMFVDRLVSIFRAAGIEPTGWWQHRADPTPVKNYAGQ